MDTTNTQATQQDVQECTCETGCYCGSSCQCTPSCSCPTWD